MSFSPQSDTSRSSIYRRLLVETATFRVLQKGVLVFFMILAVIVHDDRLAVGFGFEMGGAAPEALDIFEDFAGISGVEFRARRERIRQFVKGKDALRRYIDDGLFDECAAAQRTLPSPSQCPHKKSRGLSLSDQYAAACPEDSFSVRSIARAEPVRQKALSNDEARHDPQLVATESIGGCLGALEVCAG